MQAELSPYGGCLVRWSPAVGSCGDRPPPQAQHCGLCPPLSPRGAETLPGMAGALYA